MLSISLNTNAAAHSDHREHAWALRTIGQDLADLRIEYLEIEFTGQLYSARGRVQNIQTHLKPLRGGEIPANSRRDSKANDGQQRGSPWFERSYPLHEIDRLDEQRSSQRNNHAKPPDICMLGERLRTAGIIIETKDGQLIKLTLDNYRVAFTFRGMRGQIYNEEYSTAELYRSQQNGNLLRGTGTSRDPWTMAQPRAAKRQAALMKGALKLRSDHTAKQSTRWETEER